MLETTHYYLCRPRRGELSFPGSAGRYRGGDCSRAARGRFNAFSSSQLAYRVCTPLPLWAAGRGAAPGRCTGPPNGIAGGDGGGAGGGRGRYRGGDCSRAARGRFNAFSSSRLAFRVRTPSSLGEAGRGTAPGRCTGPPNGGNSGGGAGGGRGRYRGGECSRAARRTPFYFSGLRISNRRLARGYTGLIRAAGGRPTWHSLQAAGRGGGAGRRGAAVGPPHGTLRA